MRPPGLEELREIFKDDRLHLAVGIVQSLELPADRSELKVTVNVLPEQIPMICRMTWEAVGPNAGIYQFPQQNDLILLGYLEGHEDEAFVLKRLSSKEDKIPLQAVDGATVIRAIAGKKAHLISDTAIFLGRGGSDPGERLVLGEIFKAAYSEHLDIDAKHKHIGNMGFVTTPPVTASEYEALKASPVDDDGMLSDVAKTEK